MKYHDITNNEKLTASKARKGLDADQVREQIRRMLTVGERARYATNYGAAFIL